MDAQELRAKQRSDRDFLDFFSKRPNFSKAYAGFDDRKSPLWRLLAQYQVSRTLSRDGAKRVSHEQVYEHVYKVTGKWGHLSLTEKAKALLHDFPKVGNTKNAKGPLSAASKIGWFLSPSGWTIFDSRACTALGEFDFLRFYTILDGLGFTALCSAARQIIQSSEAHAYPEKIVDQLLYDLGGENRQEIEVRESHRNVGSAFSSLPEAERFNQYLKLRCLAR